MSKCENVDNCAILGVETSPLHNSIILENIFSHLNESEKRSARLVCREWDSETLHEFRKGITRPIKDWVSLAAQRSCYTGSKLDFKNLNTLLMNSSTPELLMEFIDINRLHSIFQPVTEMQICFKHYGIHIKSLSINDLTSLNEQRIHQIMYTLCPNLVSLHLGNKVYNGSRPNISNPIFETSGGPEPLLWSRPLQSLQILTLSENWFLHPHGISKEHYKWIAEMINAAPSLSYLKLSNETLELLLPHLNTDLVKPLQQLITLIIHEYDENDNGVTRLLPIVAHTIEQLDLFAINQARDWDFPVMKKLKEFSIVVFIPDRSFCIREIFNVMPNLQTLKMGSHPKLRTSQLRFFSSGILPFQQALSNILFYGVNLTKNKKDKIYFPTLKSFFILNDYFLSYRNIQKICAVFPNLESLSFQFFLADYTLQNNTLKDIAAVISTLKHLQTLEILIIWSDINWNKKSKFAKKFYADLRQFLLASRLSSLHITTNTVPNDLFKNLRAYSRLVQSWDFTLKVFRRQNGYFSIHVDSIF